MIYSLTVATYCTLIRIVLIPLLVSCILHQYWLCALVIFACASITDFLDGFLARLLNQETEFGKQLDPLADKLLLLSTFFTLYKVQPVPCVQSWFIYILFVKEIAILVGALVMIYFKIPVISPTKFAKWVTALEMIFISYLMLLFLNVVSMLPYIEYYFYFFSVSFMVILCDYTYKLLKS